MNKRRALMQEILNVQADIRLFDYEYGVLNRIQLLEKTLTEVSSLTSKMFQYLCEENKEESDEEI